MNACNLTAAVTALANTIACGLKAEEITLLSSVFMQLGDTLYNGPLVKTTLEEIIVNTF